MSTNGFDFSIRLLLLFAVWLTATAGCVLAAPNTSVEDLKRAIVRHLPEDPLTLNIDQVFDRALVTKIGDGERKMLLVVDPDNVDFVALQHNAGYVDNVTIYQVVMPIKGLDADTKDLARYLWISEQFPDKLAIWTTGLPAPLQSHAFDRKRP